MSHRSTDRAFAIPELLIAILEPLVTHTESLQAAILVNRAWAEQGSNVLWRAPPVEALAFIERPRQQFYAQKIQRLVFSGDEGTHHADFSHLTFSRLKSVDIDAYRQKPGSVSIGQYLQTNLELLMFYGSNLNINLLQHLRDHCPRLTQVLIDNLDTDADDREFLPFLQQSKALESISFTYSEKTVPDEIFIHLAGRDNLKSLEMGNAVSNSAVQRVAKTLPTPFQSLLRLIAWIRAPAIRPFLSIIQSIQDLSLNIIDGANGEMLPLLTSSVKSLTALELVLHDSIEFSSEELLSLCRLENLRRLAIPSVAPLLAATLTDEDFHTLTKHLPRLTQLLLEVNLSLSTSALISLGKNCPRLESCDIYGTYEILDLSQEPAPLYPNLRLLSVGNAVDVARDVQTGNDSEFKQQRTAKAKRIASLLLEHAPKLDEIDMQHNDEFGGLVVKETEALIE